MPGRHRDGHAAGMPAGRRFREEPESRRPPSPLLKHPPPSPPQHIHLSLIRPNPLLLSPTPSAPDSAKHTPTSPHNSPPAATAYPNAEPATANPSSSTACEKPKTRARAKQNSPPNVRRGGRGSRRAGFKNLRAQKSPPQLIQLSLIRPQSAFRHQPSPSPDSATHTPTSPHRYCLA